MKPIYIAIAIFASVNCNGMDKEAGVKSYHPSCEADIRPFATKEIRKLTTVVYSYTKEKEIPGIYESEVACSLHPDKTKVYMDKGRCVGFINYGARRPSMWQRVTKQGTTVAIHHLAVQEEYKRMGVGTALIKSVIADCNARGVENIIVTTNDFNVEPWYKRFGFTAIGYGSRGFGSMVARHELRLQPALSVMAFIWKHIKAIK